MLNKIVRALTPSKYLKETAEREERTREVVEKSRRARRSAEARMIQSYREMGVAIERHSWRD